MRWRGQSIGEKDASALPGLETLEGLVRSVTTPEFQGVTFHEVHAKSALNHVPAMSAMPFDWTVNPYRGCTHACSYCLAPETLVLCADGRQRPIGELAVGDEIVGTEVRGAYRRYTATRVLASWRTRKRAFRITLADGTQLTASGDHRFLTERGWKHVTGSMGGAGQRPFLTLNNRLMGFGMSTVPPIGEPVDQDRRRGYLSGMILGDGMIFHGSYERPGRNGDVHRFRLALADEEALDRARRYLGAEGVATYTRPFTPRSDSRRAMTAIHTAKAAEVARIERLIGIPDAPSRAWREGFLSGIFDAEGSYSRGILRIVNTDRSIIALTAASLDEIGVPYVIEPMRANGVIGVRVTGGLPSHQRFFSRVRPAITRKLSIVGTAIKTVADLSVASIEDLGVEVDMVDITTGTGDFIAAGVVSHNCFARNTHTYLDLDAGRDFDSQVVVKVNVADVLRRELAKPTWAREPVALGTNTDPYQRAEGRYRLMPEIIGALAESRTPLSILTKGTLLRRDLPLLADAATRVPISLAMSIAVFDDALQAAIEPGTPSAAARLATVRAATDAGFRVSVFLMPLLPHITDSAPAIDDALARIRAAGATRVVFGALNLRPGAKEWFWQWLERDHPELVPAYRGLYPGASAYAPEGYRKMLAARVRPLLRRHGLGGGAEEEVENRPPRAGPVRTTARGARAAPAPRGEALAATRLF